MNRLEYISKRHIQWKALNKNHIKYNAWYTMNIIIYIEYNVNNVCIECNVCHKKGQ